MAFLCASKQNLCSNCQHVNVPKQQHKKTNHLNTITSTSTTFTSVLNTTGVASYLNGFHKRVYKRFQGPFSSTPLQCRQKSSCSPEQLPPLKTKRVQATAPPLFSFQNEKKINQFYMRETRMLTLRSHLITLKD